MIRKRRRSNAPLRTVFLPQELITEILSFLKVKTIIQLKCLSKSWNLLISHSNFVQKHLKNSSQNPHLTLVWYRRENTSPLHILRDYLHLYEMPYNVLLYPVHGLFKKPSINVYRNYFHCLEQGWKVVGSCNGLVCLLGCTRRPDEYWLRFWNPATGMKSEPLGCFSDNLGYKFTFGYDASTRTYKVVAFLVKRKNIAQWETKVKVFNLSECSLRNIKSFPVVPLKNDDNDGEHLSGTVNWLAKDKSEQLVIVSLDLSTETYKQFLLPPGFDDDVPFFQPVLRVLMDSICFSHDSKKTEFVLWQMKEYMVQESWTQLFKISYHNLQMHLPRDININKIFDYDFQLTCLYINGDTVIFATKIRSQSSRSLNQIRNQAFIYNLKDNTVKEINCKNCIQWFEKAKDYVESLVSVPWEESATAT